MADPVWRAKAEADIGNDPDFRKLPPHQQEEILEVHAENLRKEAEAAKRRPQAGQSRRRRKTRKSRRRV